MCLCGGVPTLRLSAAFTTMMMMMATVSDSLASMRIETGGGNIHFDTHTLSLVGSLEAGDARVLHITIPTASRRHALMPTGWPTSTLIRHTEKGKDRSRVTHPFFLVPSPIFYRTCGLVSARIPCCSWATVSMVVAYTTHSTHFTFLKTKRRWLVTKPKRLAPCMGRDNTAVDTRNMPRLVA